MVLEGQLTVRYDDHEETFEAGDAFYMPPGHTPSTRAGTEFFRIGPADELATTEAALPESLQAR